jgi:hypothetical protein
MANLFSLAGQIRSEERKKEREREEVGWREQGRRGQR